MVQAQQCFGSLKHITQRSNHASPLPTQKTKIEQEPRNPRERRNPAIARCIPFGISTDTLRGKRYGYIPSVFLPVSQFSPPRYKGKRPSLARPKGRGKPPPRKDQERQKRKAARRPSRQPEQRARFVSPVIREAQRDPPSPNPHDASKQRRNTRLPVPLPRYFRTPRKKTKRRTTSNFPDSAILPSFLPRTTKWRPRPSDP